MPDGRSGLTVRRWEGIGVHPTPKLLVRGFARAVVAAALRTHARGATIRILDACAGDGRLGHALSRRLSRLGYKPQLTLIEASFDQAIGSNCTYYAEQKICDFFSYSDSRSFDIVVSNPPYLSLGKAEAKAFGFDWSEVVSCGRNLYGLALSRCINLCRDGGLVGFLAPHGWMRNSYAAGIRELVNQRVSCLEVRASSSRRLFPNVHQDVSVQVFELRDRIIQDAHTSVEISYDAAKPSTVDLCGMQPTRFTSLADVRVRVGAFVWNRQQDLLSMRSGVGLPVVYGGNISVAGELNFDVQRYAGRRHIAGSRVPSSYISTGPCIVLKRSMRGVPGDWRLDFAVVKSSKFAFVAENHVIVIELPKQTSADDARVIAETVRYKIEVAHKHHGHPNLSVSIVKQAVANIESLKYRKGDGGS